MGIEPTVDDSGRRPLVLKASRSEKRKPFGKADLQPKPLRRLMQWLARGCSRVRAIARV